MQTIRFGPFTYNTATGSLIKDGEEQILRQQVHALLNTFLEQEGILLSRSELIAAVWPQEHVEPNTFFQCMNHLRKALGENAEAPQFIQNFPRKGYVWICPVTRAPSRKARKTRAMWLLGLAALFLFAWFVAFFSKPPTSSVLSGHALNARKAPQAQKPLANPSSGNLPAVYTAQPSKHSQVENDGIPSSYLSRHMAKMDGDYPQAFAEAKSAFDNRDPMTCERLLRNLLDRAQREDYREAEAMAQLSLAKILRLRSPIAAKQYLSKSRLHFFDLGDAEKYHEATFILTLVQLDLGEWDSAANLLQNDLAPRGRHKRKQRIYYALAKGLWHLKTGDLASAQKALQTGRRHLRNRRASKNSLQFDLLEAAILFAQSKYETSYQHCQRIVLNAQSAGQPIIDLQARWLMVQMEALSNQPGQARQHYAQIDAQANLFALDFFRAKATWTLRQLQPDHLPAFPIENTISQDHQRFIEHLVKTSKQDLLPAGTRLFNL